MLYAIHPFLLSSETMNQLILGSPSKSEKQNHFTFDEDPKRNMVSPKSGALEAFAQSNRTIANRSPARPKSACNRKANEVMVSHSGSLRDLVTRPFASGQGGEDLINPAKELYLTTFNGLQSYGETGMTQLEELIEVALKACEIARKTCPFMETFIGAALFTESGKIFSGCNLESQSNSMMNLSAERTTILKAVSEGKRDV